MGQIFIRLKGWCYTEAAEQLSKAASRVMAWLGNSRLSAQHCIVRNQSINNCYSMFMCHVSMTKRSHLIIRVLKLKVKMTNDNFFFFLFKCMGGNHRLLTGIPLTRIQAQNTINMKNLCTLFNSIHGVGVTKISYYQSENCSVNLHSADSKFWCRLAIILIIFHQGGILNWNYCIAFCSVIVHERGLANIY